MNQQDIWKCLQQGDEQALNTFFTMYYEPLCGFLLQYNNDLDAAKDIVQGVFMEFWEKRETLVIKESVKSYLYRSVYNAFIDNARKDKRQNDMLGELKYQALMADNDDDETLYKEKIKKLREEIDALPPRCKQILLMSKVEGYKYHEIAEMLGVSVKTIETQMRLAYQKIREGFQDDAMFLFILGQTLSEYD